MTASDFRTKDALVSDAAEIVVRYQNFTSVVKYLGFHRYLCLGSSNKKRYFALRMPPSSLVLSPGESGIIEVMIFP